MKVSYTHAIEESGVLVALAAFDPHVAGTLPLGIAIETSDIDILCTYSDPFAYTDAVVAAFGAADGFSLAQWSSGRRAIVARFISSGWEFEIFAESTPVALQPGWRHFDIEQRLLRLAAPSLRDAIVAAKQSGLKTEPAFAHLLELEGDPYAALLELEAQPESALRQRLRRAGFAAS